MQCEQGGRPSGITAPAARRAADVERAMRLIDEPAHLRKACPGCAVRRGLRQKGRQARLRHAAAIVADERTDACRTCLRGRGRELAMSSNTVRSNHSSLVCMIAPLVPASKRSSTWLPAIESSNGVSSASRAARSSLTGADAGAEAIAPKRLRMSWARSRKSGNSRDVLERPAHATLHISPGSLASSGDRANAEIPVVFRISRDPAPAPPRL